MDNCDKPDDDNDDDDGTMSASGVGVDPSQVPAGTQGLEESPQRSPDVGAIGRPDSPSTTLVLFDDFETPRCHKSQPRSFANSGEDVTATQPWDESQVLDEECNGSCEYDAEVDGETNSCQRIHLTSLLHREDRTLLL
jgi:hypothetical protein